MNILITGGSSGLGRSVVEKCAGHGNNVYFTYNSKQNAAAELMRAYPDVHAIHADFRDPDSVRRLVAQIPALDVDVLVNNAYAGTPQGTYFHKTPIEDFERSFQTNLLPAIRIAQACISVFRKKKFGKIINVLTSYLLDLPPMGFAVYTADKAYLQQLSRCWCKENAKFNITSNCVMPEYMQTTFAAVDERIVEQMVQAHPLKRLLQPAEVADVIVWIISASQQLNGVTIPVNAAQHIY